MALKVSQRNILRKAKPGQERCSKNWRFRQSSAESLLIPINEAKAREDKENYLTPGYANTVLLIYSWLLLLLLLSHMPYP